jgi:two-component system NarL family sensor kinase
MLDDLGVAAALEQLTRELSEESGIEIGFTQIAHTHAATLPDAVNTVLFRIAQEALTNIVRHAQASSAALALEISHDTVTLTIADNGRGFDVTHAFVGRRSGVGLRNMRERLEALGGTLSLASQAGHTVVSARVPLQTSDAPLSPLLDIRP